MFLESYSTNNDHAIIPTPPTPVQTSYLVWHADLGDDDDDKVAQGNGEKPRCLKNSLHTGWGLGEYFMLKPGENNHNFYELYNIIFSRKSGKMHMESPSIFYHRFALTRVTTGHSGIRP